MRLHPCAVFHLRDQAASSCMCTIYERGPQAFRRIPADEGRIGGVQRSSSQIDLEVDDVNRRDRERINMV